MPEIEVPCPTCSGTGESTHEDRHAGTDKDVCRTCGGRRTIPARPGESREASWPWAVPGAEPPSSTPGEAERLVDALVSAVMQHAWYALSELFNEEKEAETRAARDAARTALLSHISTADRASSPTPDGVIKERGEDERRPDGPGLSLRALHAANIARQAEWCPDQVPDLSFRGNELAGEVGEACNVVKKLERERHGWRGSRATLDDLAQELADVVICADLCAVTAGIDLDTAVVAKFNATSRKQRLSTLLPEAPAAAASIPGAGAHRAAPRNEYGLWRCPDCRCHSHACILGEADLVRCVNCKEIFVCARDQRAEREDGDSRPRPEAASPIGKAEAPASTVQPPSSQEGGVGEISALAAGIKAGLYDWREKVTGCRSYLIPPHDMAVILRVLEEAAPRPSQREG